MRLHVLAVTFSICLSACGPMPSNEAKSPRAPDAYRVRFETTRGVFVIEVTRAWAPYGADRFYGLLQDHFYDGSRFFRVVPGFVAQFGLKGIVGKDLYWSQMTLPDDEVQQNNVRGTVTFAMAGPATRTTQVFINLRDNTYLDTRRFAPFAKVVSGMEVVDQLYGGYGDGPPNGKGPDQERIQQEGNGYLEKEFPKLDYIKTAKVQ
jgi:cyclophilin family peptidyl-prolyl cis-trans isomerase